MPRHYKSEMPELLSSCIDLADDKVAAYVEYVTKKENLDLFQASFLKDIMTKYNTEGFCREWRATQRNNPHLRGKEWEKRQREEVKVRHTYDPNFFEKIDQMTVEDRMNR